MLKTRIPLKHVGDATIAIVVGTPPVTLGEVASVKDLSVLRTHRDLMVRDVIVSPIIDLSGELLQTLGYTNFSELRLDLSQSSGLGIPAEAEVTVVFFAREKSDLEEVYSEVEFGDDISPLVFPGEDLDEDSEEEDF